MNKDVHQQGSFLVRDIEKQDNLSSMPQLLADAFGEKMDLATATLLADIAGEEGLLALDSETKELVGCNFLTPSIGNHIFELHVNNHNLDDTRGVGPIAVKPSLHGQGLGRQLMERIIDRAKHEGAKRITLLQDASNLFSLSLYLKVGFRVTSHYGEFSGLCQTNAGPTDDNRYTVRPFEADDANKVEELWQAACGYSLKSAISSAVKDDHSTAPYSTRPYVVLEGANLVGFTFGLFFTKQTLARDLGVLQVLVRHVSAQCAGGDQDLPTLLVSLEDHGDLVEWLLAEKFKLQGTYNQMVHKDSIAWVQPRDGWLYLPSMGGC